MNKGKLWKSAENIPKENIMSLLQFTFYFSFWNRLVWLHRWVHNTSSRSYWSRPKRTPTLLPPCVRERWGIIPNLLESQQTFSRCALPLSAPCLIKHVESRSLKASCLFFWRSRPSLLELCNSKGLREERRSVNATEIRRQHGLCVNSGSQFNWLVLLPWSTCPHWPLLWNGTEGTGLRSFRFP